MNIFVGLMCIAAVAAGVFGWWMEHGSFQSDDTAKPKGKDNSKTEEGGDEQVGE